MINSNETYVNALTHSVLEDMGPILEAEGLTSVKRSMLELLEHGGVEYSGKFTHGKNRIHYLEYGDPSNPTVILLHGMGGGGAAWFRQIPFFAKRFHVLVPDNPSFGLSYQPLIQPPLTQFALDYLIGFMEETGVKKASLVGFSLGGLSVLQTAIKAPEKVEKLVIIDSVGIGKELPWVYRLISLHGIGKVMTRPNRWITKRFLTTWSKNSDGLAIEKYTNYIHASFKRKLLRSTFHHNMRQFADLKGQKHVVTDRELMSIGCPTLAIWGDRDSQFPVSHAERVARLVPNSQIEILKRAGHMVIWDKPEEITKKVLAFLESGVRTGSPQV